VLGEPLEVALAVGHLVDARLEEEDRQEEGREDLQDEVDERAVGGPSPILARTSPAASDCLRDDGRPGHRSKYCNH
jgi:hypothetical protein